MVRILGLFVVAVCLKPVETVEAVEAVEASELALEIGQLRCHATADDFSVEVLDEAALVVFAAQSLRK
jgi:hypothetical protein